MWPVNDEIRLLRNNWGQEHCTNCRCLIPKGQSTIGTFRNQIRNSEEASASHRQ